MEPRNRPTVPARPEQYRALLKEFAESNPDFAEDLISDDFEALIDKMRAYKRASHPTDRRVIMACGITPKGNVHVEWKE